MVICLNGIDGSGKSSQAHRLVAQLNAAGYPAVYEWGGGQRIFRRSLIRLIKRGLKLPSAKRPCAAGEPAHMSYEAYYERTERVFKHRWLRMAWLHSSLLEHALELWWRILPHLWQGRIVVCDRYLHDSLVRMAVLAGWDECSMLRVARVLRWYAVPRVAKSFWIDVPADVAFARKDDIPALLFLERRIPLYRALAQQQHMVMIDGTQSIEQIATALWMQVAPLVEWKQRHSEQPFVR